MYSSHNSDSTELERMWFFAITTSSRIFQSYFMNFNFKSVSYQILKYTNWPKVVRDMKNCQERVHLMPSDSAILSVFFTEYQMIEQNGHFLYAAIIIPRLLAQLKIYTKLMCYQFNKNLKNSTSSSFRLTFFLIWNPFHLSVGIFWHLNRCWNLYHGMRD